MDWKVLEVVVAFCILASFKSSSFSVAVGPITFCENQLAKFECPLDRRQIFIKTATYGRTTKNVCLHKHNGNTQCGMQDNVGRRVKFVCYGLRQCEFEVTNDLFGSDPCPGTYKYLVIEYDCREPTFV